jgi:putative nucleotidyltransferase with HDIG domain
MIRLSELLPINERNKVFLRVPNDIKKIYKLFKKNKKQLYIVGGAVRDAILGKSPKDYDMATDATPDEVLAIAKKGGFKTLEIGKSFGVVVVGGHEIATFRKDIGKGRRPDAVDFTDIQGDIKRRDLTINALFYDIGREEIVDLVGGLEDLKKKLVKTVGQAELRFDEDPLRKLRALRFNAALGGTMHADTYAALKKNPSLKGVSSERIRDEFVKSIVKAKSPKKYMELCDKLGFTKQILPGLKVSKPYVNENDFIVFLACILRKNDVNSLRKLNGLTYSNNDIENIQFLNILQTFKPENVYKVKKFQERTTLSNNQIIKWGKYIGNDFKKLVKFKLSVKGNEVPKDVKGPEIGKVIQAMEKEKFLNENSDKAKLYKLYTKAMKMMPGSPAQKKISKEIDKLRKKLGMNEIAVRKKPKKFKDIYNALPSDLKKRVYNLKNYDQRRDAHPEGNVLKHTIAVTNRALKTGDIDFALSALFHDIGKDETAGIHPKKGHITHYGHEHVSAKLVKKYGRWIKSMGGNVLDIYWIVKQHMRMKVFDKMKWTKQEKMKKFRAFGKLKRFSKDFDRGGRR